LINAFCANAAHFHADDGKGYKFIGDIIAQVDKLNPQNSSRLLKGAFIQWKRYNEERGTLMKAELQKLADTSISADLSEIVILGLK